MKKRKHVCISILLSVMMAITPLFSYTFFNVYAASSCSCEYQSLTFDADKVYINGIIMKNGSPLTSTSSVTLNSPYTDSGITLISGSGGEISVSIPQSSLGTIGNIAYFSLLESGIDVSWQLPSNMWIPDLYIGNGRKAHFMTSSDVSRLGIRADVFEHGLAFDVDGVYYYVDGKKKSGAIAHYGDIVAARNGIYYFDPVTFKMQTGLVTYDGMTFYHGENGLRQTGMIYIDGVLYYFSPRAGGQMTPFVQSVTMKKKAIVLYAGETSTPGVNIVPADSENKTPEWTSDNTRVATVSANGKITAKNPGTAVITATTRKVGSLDTDLSDSLTVTVLSRPVIQISGPASLVVDTEGTYSVKVTGVESDQTYTVSLELVDSQGVVECKGESCEELIVGALKEGTFIIRATVVFEGNTYVQTYDVTVTEATESHILIMRLNSVKALLDDERIDTDPTNDTVAPFTLMGKTMVPVRFMANMGAHIKYNGATKPVVVTYGDITLTLEFGKDTMTRVVGNGSPETITLPTAPSLVEGKTYVPVREVAEGIGLSVRYNSSKHVIVVSTIKLTDDDLTANEEKGKKELETYVGGVKSITATVSNYTIKKGKSLNLEKDNIVFKPTKVGCTRLLYSSDNESVATVTSNGKINAKSQGTAHITISSHNGKKTVITITVS